jgi:MYXO-CTERM domain-containing protein
MTRETSPAALRFALAAALVAAGSCGQLPSDAATSSAPIFGGTVDTGNEAVMALVHQMGTTGANVCTGTTIAKVGASGIFLTAAHCVSLTQNGKVVVPVKVAATDELYVIPGPDWETSLRAGLYYGVSAVTMHPQYDGNVNTPYDLALVRFVGATASTPVIPTVTAAEDAALAAGTPFTLVGFGKTETNANNSQRRKVDRVVESFTVAQFLYDQRDLKGACQGDSGGPALLSTSGGARVLGVTSFGDEKCTDLGVSVRVAPAASLIQSFISGTPAALSCADCTQAAVSPGNACTAMAAACGDMTTACGKFLACAEACSTQACFNGCKVTYAVGAAAYDMMAICQCNGACQDACRTNSACSPYIKNVAPPTCEQVSDSRPACTACLRGTCCDQAAACAGDADCMACTRLATTGCRTNAAFIALTSCKATCAGNPCTDTVTPDAGAPQQPTDADGAQPQPDAASPDTGGTKASGGSGGCGCALAAAPAPGAFVVFAVYLALALARRRR